MSAWMVGGTTGSPSDSAAMAVICSTKSGLPSAACEQRRSRVLADQRLAADMVEERLRLAHGERAERDVGRRRQHARPLGPLLDEVAARHAEQQDRRGVAPLRDVLEQVEERRLRPVHVLDAHDERRAGGERLEQPPHRPERLLAAERAVVAADRRSHAPGDPLRVRLVGEQAVERLVAAELLHELAERPVRDPLAVGEAAAAQHGRRPADLAEQLGREPRLADSGRPGDRAEQAAPFGQHALEHPADALEARPSGRRAGRRAAARQPAAHGSTASSGSAVTTSRLPFTVSCRLAPTVTASRTNGYVVSPSRISPVSADCSRRLARFTASPVTNASAWPGSPASTSPVLTPIRHESATPCGAATSRSSRSTAARISNAAPTARSASSSWTEGTPKTAITSSPLNFSTVPP